MDVLILPGAFHTLALSTRGEVLWANSNPSPNPNPNPDPNPNPNPNPNPSPDPNPNPYPTLTPTLTLTLTRSSPWATPPGPTVPTATCSAAVPMGSTLGTARWRVAGSLLHRLTNPLTHSLA
jgi:hypothetical protein